MATRIAARADGAGRMTELGPAVQLSYGVGQVAGQIFRDVPSLLLLFFLTTVLGMAPVTAGAAIFLPKMLWGVGSDFAIGVLSDRWRRRFPRRYWLLVGMAGAPVAMLLLFHVPAGSVTLRVVYVAGVFSLYMAVFASFSVPYLAIAGELAASRRQRNVIMAWRLVFTAAGVLVAGALAPMIVQANGGGQQGYRAMSVVLAIICPAALLLAFFGSGRVGSRAATADAPVADRLSWREAIALLLAPRFSILLGANLLQLIGSGMAYASMLYFLTYAMARTDALALVGGLVFAMCAAIILSQPLWLAVATRIGNRRGYLAATAVFATGYFAWFFAAHGGIATAYALAFVVAVGNAGWAMLGFSMMSDIAAADDRHAGLYSAAWIATDKIAFALGGTLMVGLVLTAFGFDSSRAVAGLPQSPRALVGVMVAFTLAPAALNAIGGLILARWGRD